jgi:hypothetical protein
VTVAAASESESEAAAAISIAWHCTAAAISNVIDRGQTRSKKKKGGNI